jgi:hypothetical protein
LAPKKKDRIRGVHKKRERDQKVDEKKEGESIEKPRWGVRRLLPSVWSH